MDYVGDHMSYIIKKTIDIIINRFIFADRIRISEFFDMILDNLYKILPKNLVKHVHEVFDAIVDELMWS